MSTLKTNNIQHVDRSDPSILINTDGSVSIAGTMTYEDVTNVDAVGIITGRNNIDAQKQVLVGTGVSVKAGGLNVTAGITTVQALQATTGTFSGDVDIADKIIHTGDTNTAIRFPASNTVTVETDGSERLRITSDGTIGQGITSPDDLFHISTAQNASKGLRITNTNNSQASANARVFISGGDNARAALRLETNGQFHDIFERNTGELTIEDNGSEKLRLDSSGRLCLGTTTVYGASGTGTMMVSVKGDGASRTDISVSNQSSVDNASAAVVLATHGQDYVLEATGSGNSTDGVSAFRILKSSTERFRIDTNGRVSISDNTRPASDVNEGAQLRVNGTPLTRNQYYSPAGDYYGSFGYTDNTYTKSWIAVDSAYAKSSAVSAGVFLSAFHQDTGGSSCGFTIKNLKDGNPLVFSSVVTGSSTSTAAVETERLRIDSTGRVFVGNTQDSAPFSWGLGLQVSGTGTNAGLSIRRDSNNSGGALLMFVKSRGSLNGNTAVQENDQIGGIYFNAADGTDVNSYSAQIAAEIDGAPGSNDVPGRLVFSTTADGSSSPSERMRIAKNGAMFFGCTDVTDSGSSVANNFAFSGDGNPTIVRSHSNMIYGATTNSADRHAMQLVQHRYNRYNFVSVHTNTGITGPHLLFYQGSNAVGSIHTDDSNTYFNTSSDYRLKENETVITDGITRLKTLIPRRFNWKIDETNTPVDGFFAHEVTAVPEAVTGTKDQVATADDVSFETKEGDPIYQSIDQSKLVPLLTAALQEAVAKIETLETKVAALEGS